MPAPDAILKLCETFADHRDHYRSGNYNEAQLRKEFLEPRWTARSPPPPPGSTAWIMTSLT